MKGQPHVLLLRSSATSRWHEDSLSCPFKCCLWKTPAELLTTPHQTSHHYILIPSQEGFNGQCLTAAEAVCIGDILWNGHALPPWRLPGCRVRPPRALQGRPVAIACAPGLCKRIATRVCLLCWGLGPDDRWGPTLEPCKSAQGCRTLQGPLMAAGVLDRSGASDKVLLLFS